MIIAWRACADLELLHWVRGVLEESAIELWAGEESTDRAEHGVSHSWLYTS